MNTKDYYRTLGVAPDVTPQAIKDAYRKLAYQYHPDRNQANARALEMMKAVNEAYAVLSDPAKRRQYDTLRRQFGSDAHQRFRQAYTDQDIFRGSDVHRVFEEMARSFGFRGVDEIFREFYGPGYRSFEFRRPGVFARGFVFTSTGPPRGGRRRQNRNGGLMEKAARALRQAAGGAPLPGKGPDVHDRIRIDPELARTGGPYAYRVPHTDRKLVVKLPAGVKHGQRIRLAGMGRVGRSGAGDLYLKVRIRRPLLAVVKDTLGRLLQRPQ
jgi:DnaJ-class molecular chaperone